MEFNLNFKGSIQNLGFGGKMCLDAGINNKKTEISMKGCHGRGKEQFWMYDGIIERDNFCITYSGKLFTMRCKRYSAQVKASFSVDSRSGHFQFLPMPSTVNSRSVLALSRSKKSLEIVSEVCYSSKNY